MSHEDPLKSRRGGTASESGGTAGASGLEPGKQSMVEVLQRKQQDDAKRMGPMPSASAGGGGQALPEDVRSKMEGSFGADFSAVRVHEGGGAPAVGARAFAQGTDLHFAPGEYQPQSPAGQALIGHELAHVVQQSQGRVGATTQAKGADGAAVHVNDDASLEHEADEQGARAARGEPAGGHAGSAAGGGGAPAPIQRAAGPIQMAKYSSPTDAAIAAAMTAAGITSFGPYEWDDTNPKAKMFKVKAGFAWSIGDCVNRASYEPETKAVAEEKGTKAGLIGQRVAAARKALFGQAKGPIEKIMEHDEGRTPRAVASLAAEDAASGGHIVERHILGAGLMTGHRQVALRAAFWKVGGVRMDLDAAGTATVFASDAVALGSVQAALAAELAANWATHRATLAKGTQVKITHAVAVNVVGYTKHDAPLGAPYDEAVMPKYLEPAKAGDRELYRGDYAGAGRPADPNAPDKAKDALTTGGARVMNNVYLIVDPNQNAPGGWAVYTTYPK